MNKEQILQAECTQWFNNTYLQYSKCCFAVNNNSDNKVKAMQMKAIGLRAGVSDVIVLCPGGKTLLLEAKTDEGTQSKDQKEFERQATSLGHEYKIFRSLEQFQKIIFSHFPN